MMNRRKKNNKKKYIIIIIIVVIILVIAFFSYTLKKDKKLNFIEVIIKDTVVGIERVVNTSFNYIGGVFSNYKNLHSVLEENDILKNKIEESVRIETENEELKRELEVLKKELDIDYVLTDYTYLNATVVSRNTGYWYNTITLDKGKHNDVEVGMVVINSYGLIGRVVSVSNFSCDVRLVTANDTDNKISVSILNNDNKVVGLIEEYNFDKKVLQVEGISNTSSVLIGDKVYTSGLGGVFPSGILIGTVESISTDTFDLSKIINVTPSVNFDDINFVSILKRDDDIDD